MNDLAALQKEIELLRTQLVAEKENTHRALKIEQEKIEERDQQIFVLKEQIQTLLKKRFGSSSEKAAPDQLGLFNEAESIQKEEDATPDDDHAVASRPDRQKPTKPRVSIADHHPREDIEYDLSEEQKHCPHDGTSLKLIGSEDHEQVEIIPAQVKVIRHRRLKYSCPCCKQFVITASKPKQPIEKSIASPSLLAFIAIQKYVDALPLYRQSEMFKRIGINLDRTNLANWMVKCGELVQPLINLLGDHLRSQPCLHLDESTLQVLDEPGKPAQSKSYMWLMTNKDLLDSTKTVCLYHYAENRSQQVPLHLLSTDTQAIMVDGYEGYQKACDQYDIIRLGCWAHARRKFKEAQAVQPKGKAGKSDQALAFIQKLYAIEKRIKDEPPDKRFDVRQQEAKPILDKLKIWMEKSLQTVLPKTAIGKALVYLSNQWDRLVHYIEDGHYPIDNNAAERVIRPFTIGRKNWMFSKSQAGAKASANLYSLIETAKANNLNVYEYLKHIFKELPNAKTVENVEALLPWNMKLD